MAERVIAAAGSEVDAVLKERARDWVLVAVLSRQIAAIGEFGQLSTPMEYRELYFERRER